MFRNFIIVFDQNSYSDNTYLMVIKKKFMESVLTSSSEHSFINTKRKLSLIYLIVQHLTLSGLQQLANKLKSTPLNGVAYTLTTFQHR